VKEDSPGRIQGNHLDKLLPRAHRKGIILVDPEKGENRRGKNKTASEKERTGET